MPARENRFSIQWGPIAFLLIGIGYFVQALLIPRVKILSGDLVGPRGLPYVISLALITFSILDLLKIRSQKDSETVPISFSAYQMCGMFILYGILFLVFGFLLPSMLFMVVFIHLCGSRSWTADLSLSVISVAAVYGVFLLLGIRLPLL